jgi:hypothetical protein
MDSWQFLRTFKQVEQPSQHAHVLFCTHGIRMRRMEAHVACAVPRRLASLRAAAHAARWEGCVPERSACSRVQQIGGVVLMQKGELVFDGVAISDTSATVRPKDARAGRALGCVRAAGLRRTGAMCRCKEAPFTCPEAPSRSEGAARSRARGRCARPGAIIHSRACTCSTRLVLALVLALVFDVVC